MVSDRQLFDGEISNQHRRQLIYSFVRDEVAAQNESLKGSVGVESDSQGSCTPILDSVGGQVNLSDGLVGLEGFCQIRSFLRREVVSEVLLVNVVSFVTVDRQASQCVIVSQRLREKFGKVLVAREYFGCYVLFVAVPNVRSPLQLRSCSSIIDRALQYAERPT